MTDEQKCNNDFQWHRTFLHCLVNATVFIGVPRIYNGGVSV